MFDKYRLGAVLAKWEIEDFVIKTLVVTLPLSMWPWDANDSSRLTSKVIGEFSKFDVVSGCDGSKSWTKIE